MDNFNGNAFPQQPKDYKTWSIVNLILSIICCGCPGIVPLILSIIAVVKSNEVARNNSIGESALPAAINASQTAKTLNIISTVWIIASLIIEIIYFSIFGVAQIMALMNM